MRKCSLGDTQYCARGWLLIVKFGVWLQLVNNGAKNVIHQLLVEVCLTHSIVGANPSRVSNPHFGALKLTRVRSHI